MEYLLQKDRLSIRRAVRSDAPAIADLIMGLAVYEHMPECCHATVPMLEESIFDRGEAKVLIAEYDGEPAGFSLYFYNYSTWLAKKGLYLEDLFVKPEMRGKGIGKSLCRPWRELRSRKTADGLNGAALTGTSRRFSFTRAWAQSRWRTGRCTGSPATP